MRRSNTPAIILVRPQLPENIGAVARAMTNFGLAELRLVKPRCGWPSTRAREVSSGGEAVIDAAKTYGDLAAALKDIQLAYATTARNRDMEKRVLGPEKAMQEIKDHISEGARCAMLFGPERTGLENDDIGWCDTLISIPTSPEHSSLNIAQSVIILAYEWFKQQGSPSLARALPEIAPLEKWDGLFGQLENYLDDVDFFRVAQKKPVMWQNLKSMLLRGRWTAQEIQTLRGMLRLLKEGRRPRKPR